MVTRKKHEGKTYDANACCIFRKTKDLYGGLSNMASGFPIKINNIKILSSEALYQLCRFPHLPEVQEKIISQKSPMSAKMAGKPFRANSRPDWDDTRIKIMRWCLKIKLAQNFIEFGKLLEITYNKPIVEDSNKDDFWGAIRDTDNANILRGVNALGRLLMELRQFYNEKRFSYEMFVVEPLSIPDFKICGQKIEIIDERGPFISYIKNITRFNEINELIDISLLNKQYDDQVIPQAIVAEAETSTLKSVPLSTSNESSEKEKKKKIQDKYAGQAELPF